MTWYKKTISNKDINSVAYQNVIKEISSQYYIHPAKIKEFAVFKENLNNNTHSLYFSPTDDPSFTAILFNVLEAEKCEKPNLNNAKLFMGKYI